MIKRILVTILICFSIFPVYGVIFEVNDLSKFEEEISKTTNDALVLIDVDETLIIIKGADPRLSCSIQYSQYLSSLTHKRREYLRSIMILDSEYVLVDPKIPSIIKNIQSKSIAAIAFTAIDTGKYGKISKIEDWRFEHLKKFDIDFSSAFAENSGTVFHNLPSRRGNFPVFKNGILLSNGLFKGDVFKSFLNKVRKNPKKVIFLDDCLKQLNSVETACKSLNIDFVGFHYLAAKNHIVSKDQNVVEFQFKNLIENEKWLSDEVASRFLQKK